MFVFIFLGLLATSLASPHGRIINGEEAGTIKYQVSIQLLAVHNCGGVIISKNKILTAGHCATYNPQLLRVVAGVNNIEGLLGITSQVRYISDVTVHPNYEIFTDAGYAINDIAIFTLSSNLVFNKWVGPATLPVPYQSFANTLCRVSGWGATFIIPGNPQPVPSAILMEANVTNISREECQPYYPDITLENHETCFIDKTATHATACSGDSGGPNMCGENLDILAGLVSWGPDYCNTTSPYVGPAVSEFLDFITANM